MRRARRFTVAMLLVMAMLTVGCGSKEEENTKWGTKGLCGGGAEGYFIFH